MQFPAKCHPQSILPAVRRHVSPDGARLVLWSGRGLHLCDCDLIHVTIVACKKGGSWRGFLSIVCASGSLSAQC